MAVVGDFTPEDQAAVRALVPAGLQERWGEAFNPGLNPDLDDLTANSLDRVAEIVVIDNATQIVATGTLSVPHPGRLPGGWSERRQVGAYCLRIPRRTLSRLTAWSALSMVSMSIDPSMAMAEPTEALTGTT